MHQNGSLERERLTQKGRNLLDLVAGVAKDEGLFGSVLCQAPPSGCQARLGAQFQPL